MEQLGRLVLVVDDNRCIRDEMVGLLMDEGYQAEGAANGLEALHYMRNTKIPSLILLDLMMPVMDGWQFCEEKLRDPLLADVPVVVITADRSAEDASRSCRASAWLEKPFNIDELLGLVSEFCGPPQRGRPAESEVERLRIRS